MVPRLDTAVRPGKDIAIGTPALVVGVDARLVPGEYGGVEQFVIGLAHGLAQLAGNGDAYLFLVYAEHADWLKPFLGANSRLIEASSTPERSSRFRTVRSAIAANAPRLRRIVRSLSTGRPGHVEVPRSDGRLEAAGAQVIHFPMQSAFLTTLPSVYQPWDLQHRHHPEFFSPGTIAWREATYRAFCESASTVVASAEFHRDDFRMAYDLPEDRMEVVRVPPPIQAYGAVSASEAAEIGARLGLPKRFLAFPARTWPHKNHLRLVRALADARDTSGERIALVCSGRVTPHHAQIAREARRLGVQDQVLFVGYLSPHEVQALYRLCTGVVFPSLFEGWGLPVVEAFWAGAPVACSRVTSLPELVGDAALLFNPLSEREICDAMVQLWTDEALRSSLAQRGREISRTLRWSEAALQYRAIYLRARARARAGAHAAEVPVERARP